MARRKKQEAVELNLAAMLDMAFQLLTFFILTFRPAPVEGQVDLRLPPPEAPGKVVIAPTPPGFDKKTPPLTKLDTLTISVHPTPDGRIQSLAIDNSEFASMGSLESHLKTVLVNPDSLVKQVVIEAGSRLRYDELMRLIDVCTRQKMADGTNLAKLSFVELPDGQR